MMNFCACAFHALENLSTFILAFKSFYNNAGYLKLQFSELEMDIRLA